MKTYNFIFLIISGIFMSACIQSTGSKEDTNADQEVKPIVLQELFSSIDAEKIMGEPVHLIDSSTISQSDVLMYKCGYKGNSEDVKSRKTGTVYFLIEQYKQVSEAQKKYSFIRSANEKNGITVLDDLGDEAYFHTDGENFYFIMVRKGPRVFNMKVNKITSKTSQEEFRLIARKITSAL
jgi:hypothetical protein